MEDLYLSHREIGGQMCQQVKKQLTMKHQGYVDERYVTDEEIEHFGPFPWGAPNVLHFQRQDQQPIVQLRAGIILDANTTVKIGTVPLTITVVVETARDSCQIIGYHRNKWTPDQELPGDGPLRIIVAINKSRGTYVDNKPPGESS